MTSKLSTLINSSYQCISTNRMLIHLSLSIFYFSHSNGKHRVLASPEDDFDLRTPLAEQNPLHQQQVNIMSQQHQQQQTQQQPDEQRRNGCCPSAQPPAMFLLGKRIIESLGLNLNESRNRDT